MHGVERLRQRLEDAVGRRSRKTCSFEAAGRRVSRREFLEAPLGHFQTGLVQPREHPGHILPRLRGRDPLRVAHDAMWPRKPKYAAMVRSRC